jgi:Rieske 2Fe-2S family protein
MALTSDGKLTLAFPNLSTDPVPTDIYWQSGWYERELEAIFSRTWLHLASGHEIPNPGDFVVKEIPTFGHKIIIVRGRDGQVRSFYNVCSHRGSHVELREKGNCRLFTCPFHGWSFDHKGKLVGLPAADDFYGLERDQKGLRSVHTEEWAHHIFVNLAEKPEESLEEYLGEFGRDVRDWPGWDTCTVSWEFKGEVKANWKLLLDAFNETYHIPTIHRNSIAPMFVTSDNPNGEILGVTRKGPHRNISLLGNHLHEPKPGQALGYDYAPGQPVTRADASATNDSLPKGLNEGRCERWGLDVATVFPNWVPVVTHQTWFSHQIWPKGPNRSEWRMRVFMPPAQTAAQRFGQEYANAELRDTVLEDSNTFERVQDSLDRGMLSHFTFRDHEVACRMQYHIVKEWVENYEKSKAANAA